jgi:hypothetical protein
MKSTTDMIRNHMPLVTTNWYLRAAWNRVFMDQMQAAIDPQGHKRLRDMQRRVQKETGQQFWWRPGEMAPSRMPGLTPGQ